ncbi:MAG: hypothetical protein HeimC3_07000 [Candidatus Heimdallarchaeota archaeon LC_3]|nr:MAG: hypothetical protein HeimC3_07000 [Candidatus Heimdallarchaeota archaeon LC_3]
MDLNHLHLHVKDIYDSKAFYIKFFEFKEKVNYDDLLFLENESKFDLALQPDNELHVFPNYFHFGFILESPNAVKEFYNKMRKEKVVIDKELMDYENLVSFRCLDPDNHKIEIYLE